MHARGATSRRANNKYKTILRREAYPSPYETLKGLTRTNASITQSSISDFIDTLEVSDALKTELKKITPQNYTGI